MRKLISDGYVRITVPAFYALRFHQHMCLDDPALLDSFRQQGVAAAHAGYYELVSTESRPLASVGCTWYVTGDRGDFRVEREEVSTNLMLLDSKGYDYGVIHSGTLIHHWLLSDARRSHIGSAIAHTIGLTAAPSKAR